MKSYVVIGLGRFGSEVSRRLCELGNEVLAMDTRADLVQQISNEVTHAVVGNAQELLGKYIQREDGSKVEALGLFDTHAVRQTPNRFNSLMRISFEGMTLLGYTSRFSHTYGLTEDIAMGHVEAGSGENPDSKLEGIRSGNVLATYLSGPVLVSNPDFAHWFLKELGQPLDKLPCEEALRQAYDQRLKDFTRDDLEMA